MRGHVGTVTRGQGVMPEECRVRMTDDRNERRQTPGPLCLALTSRSPVPSFISFALLHRPKADLHFCTTAFPLVPVSPCQLVPSRAPLASSARAHRCTAPPHPPSPIPHPPIAFPSLDSALNSALDSAPDSFLDSAPDSVLYSVLDSALDSAPSSRVQTPAPRLRFDPLGPGRDR
jgi:hypothetical protein